MQTVSNIRTEKRTNEIQAENARNKRNLRTIAWCESKIKEEKEAIIDCLDQNFFSMAESKIKRIQELQDKINNLS